MSVPSFRKRTDPLTEIFKARGCKTDLEAAERFGITTETIRQWRSGSWRPRGVYLRATAERLDITPETLAAIVDACRGRQP